MSTDSGSLEAKITRWVEEQGFPLEMHLRGIFSASGFDLVQPAFFDQESGKYRSGVDVAAMQSHVRQAPRSGEIRSYAFAAVECKLGGKKPWVVFLQPHHGAPINMVQQLTAAASDRALIERITHPAYRSNIEPLLAQDSLLLAPSKIGFGVSEFEGSQDRSLPYDAIRQVIDGAVGVCVEHKRYFSDPKHNSLTVFCAANFVVTGSRLFTCELDSSGRPIVKETDNVVFVEFRGQGQSQRMHYVRLANLEFMRRSVETLGRDLRTIATWLAQAQADFLTDSPAGAA